GNVDERSGLHLEVGGSVSASDPFGKSEPVRIVLRLELPSTRMEGISSGFYCQGMDQQQASIGFTRSNKPRYRFKVPLRLFLRPSGGTRGELFEIENAARLRVATVAPRMSGALFQEDRLYFGFEEIEIQSAAGRTGSCIPRLPGIRRWPGVNFIPDA